MEKEERLLAAFVRRAFPFRPEPDRCLDEGALKMLLHPRSEIRKEGAERLARYDSAVSHIAGCRYCAEKLKNLPMELNYYDLMERFNTRVVAGRTAMAAASVAAAVEKPDWLALAKKADREAGFRKSLETVDLTMSFVANEETGKQEVHVSYISPPHFMAHEHEKKGREIILNRLIEKGVISLENAEDVIVTREEAPPSSEDDASTRRRLRDKERY